MLFSQTQIKDLLQQQLPGAAAHKKMLPPGRVLKAAGAESGRVKKSSVLLLLFEEEQELLACLIKRPQHMKHHAGQIALPGGRMEPGETAVDTALRETEEEIGVGADKIEVIGQLSEFYVEVSRFSIQPIVGWMRERPALKLCENEVEKVIFFPLRKFAPPYANMELKTVTGKLEVPCIHYKGEIIWGATAMILSEFYALLYENSVV